MKNIEKTLKYQIDKNDAGERIDAYLAQKTDFSRSYVQKLIKSGGVLINEKPVKPKQKIAEKDKITIFIPKPEKMGLEAENIPLEILYEDEDVIVINKQRGIAAHPGAGIKNGTLVSALLYRCKNLSGIGGVLRPGIVHRLDKDTSGALIIAKNDASHINLSGQFAARKVSKIYLALVHGVPPQKEGIIEKPIGRHSVNRKKMTVREDGRPAKTSWKIIKVFTVGTGRQRLVATLSLLEVRIFTGRTHQIRVHLSSISCPVVGDPVYGKKTDAENLGLKSQFLHAHKIGFHHPKTNKYMEITAPLPLELENFLKKL